jgi:hypothetical protein
LRLHHPQFVLHAQEDAEHVGVEGGGVTLRRLLRHRTCLALCSSVVDGDIETAEVRDGAVDKSLDFALLAHIGADEFGFCAQRAKLLDQSQPRVIASTGNHQTRSLTRKSQRRGAADAGQGTGNEDNGAVHLSSPSGPVIPSRTCSGATLSNRQ